MTDRLHQSWSPKGGISTKPLTKADLRGKVVLYDFRTYSCVNCVWTIPSIRSWYEPYREDGLVVIGVVQLVQGQIISAFNRC